MAFEDQGVDHVEHLWEVEGAGRRERRKAGADESSAQTPEDINVALLPERNPPQLVCLQLADSVWVLDSVQESFQNRSPGDFESIFIKAADSETKEGLKVEEATEEDLGGAALAP